MKFGPINIDQAEGAVLAHSANTADGRIKKGRRLSQDDIDKLKRAGFTSIVVARLEANDVDEDSAAAAVAKAIAGPNVRIAEAFTGRANVFATCSGILQVDAERLVALNRIDEGLTVATLTPFARVSTGQMVATIKIIPFALDADVIAKAEGMAAQDGVGIEIAAFRRRRVGLVTTEIAGTKPSLLAKRVKAISDRVESAGSEIAASRIVAHDRDAVRNAVSDMKAQDADPILIFGASAIVDREDVIPGGVVDAGGKIVHLGMPVDPGNLLLLAKLGDRDVIGVPSCASSPKINGLDWVLERKLAGIAVERDEITAMAPGGLLMEIPSRPQPRSKAKIEDSDSAGRHAPKIAAVVLASGQSRRMGARNKLLEAYNGKPLVRHVVEAAMASVADHIVVVTGHEEEQVRGALADLPVTMTRNSNYAEGLASSLVAGIAAVPEDADGAIVLLGDMPLITPGHIDQLIAAFAPHDGRGICVPHHNGRRGNPVVWAAAYFDELQMLRGDSGAKHLIAEHAEDVTEVDVDSDAIFTDIDTPEALAVLRRR